MSIHTFFLPSVIHIGDAAVPFVSSVKNLGVILDSNLSISQHINHTCQTACIQMRQISSKRHLITTQATQTFVCSLVLSRFDYCNFLLSGCPQCLLDKLQKVQNAAAWIVCKAKKSHHIQPIFQSLHWLSVTHRIRYKISTNRFNSLSGKSPQNLSDLLFNHTLQPENYVLHPSCKHRTIRRKIIPLCRPICLEQSASVSPSLWFFFTIEYRS